MHAPLGGAGAAPPTREFSHHAPVCICTLSVGPAAGGFSFQHLQEIYSGIDHPVSLIDAVNVCFQISRLEQTWMVLRQRHTEGAILYEKKLKPFLKTLNEGKGTC